MIRASAPAGWKVKKLSDCLEKIIDYRGKSTPKDSFGYQLITARNVRFGYIELEPKEYMNPSDYKKWMTRGFPEPNDVLFTTEAPLGNVALYPTEGTYALAQRLVTLRPNKNELDSVYLFYYLLSDYAQNQVRIRATGSTATGIRQSELRKVPVIFPPLPEQRKIAEILSTWDKAIAKTEQLIAALQERKKGLMQRLLTGKVRVGSERSQTLQLTKVGHIPTSWDVKDLGNLCTAINDGTHNTPSYVDDGIPFYSVENVSANSFENTKYISEEEHNRLIKRCKPEKWDILMTRIGSLGVTKLIDWDVNASIYVSLALLKIDKRAVDPHYLFFYSGSEQFVRDIEKRSLLHAAPKKINLGEIGNVPIPIPPINEQLKIVEILETCDVEIDLQTKKLAALQQQKKGLMQRLLTGEVRVKV